MGTFFYFVRAFRVDQNVHFKFVVTDIHIWLYIRHERRSEHCAQKYFLIVKIPPQNSDIIQGKIVKIGPDVLECATRGGGRSEAGHCFHLLFFLLFLSFSPTTSAFHPLRGISRA